MEAVTRFARANGLEVEETDLAQRIVLVSGTIAQVNQAFGVELGHYETPAGHYRGREGYISVPGELADVIEGVFGLDNRQVARRAGGGGVITPVTGPMAFTGHARKALILARQEASRSGRPRGPEHILLGLVNVGDGLGVQALERLGVRPETVREQVAGQAPHPSGVGPEAPQSLRVWYAMVDEAVAHGDDYIGTEHFLLALFCDEGNAAARVLTRLGASEREVRAAVAELLAESGRERSA